MGKKLLFLAQGILSQMGDRMWFFAAYLLLAKAFPAHKILLGGFYGLCIAVTASLFSSYVGIWIDRTPRLRAALTLLTIQNLSVALCAGVQIVGLLHLTDYSLVLIGIATLLSCTAHLASIGVQIVLERDWIPQVFSGESLTSVNAWVRRIDQGAMLLGPAIAGPLIGIDPIIGAILIASWNVVSLIFEIIIMKSIYNSTPALHDTQDVESEKAKIESEYEESIIGGLKEWRDSWIKWNKSKVFIPGLALAILYANVFQLSYIVLSESIAQAYIATHCISDNLMGVTWCVAGVFGLAGTCLYESLVNKFDLVTAGVTGALIHIFFVIGTIVGLFLDGSPYVVYQRYFAMNSDYSCPDTNLTRLHSSKSNESIYEDSFIYSYKSDCEPVTSFVSVGTLIACCALSRCGLWLFDLAVNQMFQEWVGENQRGAVSGAQNAMQNVFDCVHFGIVFLWSQQCNFGHAMIVTFFMMSGGYLYFFYAAGRGDFTKVVPKVKPSSRDDQAEVVMLTKPA